MMLSFAVEIPASGALFAGHFPGRPILPGIAHLALAERALQDLMGQDVTLAAVRVLKLRRPVLPGEELELRIGLPDKEKVARFEVRCQGEPASQGTIEIRTGSTPEEDGNLGAVEVPQRAFPRPRTSSPTRLRPSSSRPSSRPRRMPSWPPPRSPPFTPW